MTSKQVTSPPWNSRRGAQAKKWFGHCAGRSPCAHSIGKFFLCYIVLFLLETSAPGLSGHYWYIYIYICMLYAFVFTRKVTCQSTVTPRSCSKARLLRWPLWGSLAAKGGPSSTGCGAPTAATENWDRRGWPRCRALPNSRKSSWCLQQDSRDKHEESRVLTSLSKFTCMKWAMLS